MLKKEVAALLEQQINKEFYSAYLYLDMSNYYYGKNLDGFGNWFKIPRRRSPTLPLVLGRISRCSTWHSTRPGKGRPSCARQL